MSNEHQIHGPAVVEEDTTTLVIEPGWMLELHKSGTYIIKQKRLLTDNFYSPKDSIIASLKYFVVS